MWRKTFAELFVGKTVGETAWKWGSLILAGVLLFGSLFVGSMVIKYSWETLIPDLFPGAFVQGLIVPKISDSAAYLLVAMLLGFTSLLCAVDFYKAVRALGRVKNLESLRVLYRFFLFTTSASPVVSMLIWTFIVLGVQLTLLNVIVVFWNTLVPEFFSGAVSIGLVSPKITLIQSLQIMSISLYGGCLLIFIAPFKLFTDVVNIKLRIDVHSIATGRYDWIEDVESRTSNATDV